VDAIDASPAMIAQARATHPHFDNITWMEGDVLALDVGTQRYDVVTAVASLHHMPTAHALERLGELVCDGGVLAILGFYRSATVADYATSLAATIAEPILMAGRAKPPAPVSMPTCRPTATLAEITAAAHRHLPGAQVKRHLFYRYSLTWRRAVR
jgi:ubiquinone/menaquinone biosynthesis C-methylase UbiE